METYISSVLRAITNAHMGMKGLRRISPFPTFEDETKFFEAVKSFLMDGWKLGCHLSSPQMANCISNRLVQSVMQYLEDTQRPRIGLELFTPLLEQDPLWADLVVKSMFLNNQECEAVGLLYKMITSNHAVLPPILRTQFDFLLGKKEMGLANSVIRQAIKTGPMDLDGWRRLARLQIEKGEIEQAMVTLNSFPYFVPQDEVPKLNNTSTGFWQPKDDFNTVDLSSYEPPNKKGNILEGLKAPNLKGTPMVAYELLVRMCEICGWDSLLKLRAEVFVMEDEYVIRRSGSVDPLAEDRQQIQDGKTKVTEMGAPPPSAITFGEDETKKKKRLCERWLDALFTVLYEDLRLYTIYKSEAAQAKIEGRTYQRTPREWVILGDLCQRIGHMDDAKEAYERCIDTGFSRKAWENLLQIWGKEGRVSHCLTAIYHLVHDALNHHEQPVYPSLISTELHRLIKDHGLVKVRSSITGLKWPERVQYYVDCLVDRIDASKSLGTKF